jgi:hypothetical protein
MRLGDALECYIVPTELRGLGPSLAPDKQRHTKTKLTTPEDEGIGNEANTKIVVILV